MLTGDLVRVRVQQGVLKPGYVEPDRPAILSQAEDLLACFHEARDQRWSRARLEAELDALVGDRRDHKLFRGLAKVLADRCAFERPTDLDPVALRDQVFRKAREMGPLALHPGPLARPTAQDVLNAVATERGEPAEALQAALYADLREAECLVDCPVQDATWLLHRYNVALVQALLLKALEVRIELKSPSPPRLRQLFRFVKFHQLVHSATLSEGELQVVLDGPLSLFRQSTRYGMQLASFFPALLLQEPPWRLQATVLWTRAKHRRRLEVDAADGLRSHLRDQGAWESREQQWFRERFEKLKCDWALQPCLQPIDLGGRAVVQPDFSFHRRGRTAHLEIVGFWRGDYLRRRLELLQRYGPGNLVLAVSRRLLGSEGTAPQLPGEVIPFAEVVPPKAVLEAVERVAR